MPLRDGYAEGIPCWVDLGTPDLEEAKVFYGRVFDWEYRDEPEAERPRVTALQRGLPAAGIGSLQDEGQTPAWMTYFAVDDADTAAARISDAGGSILLAPSDVPGAGRIAMAADPTGASFGVWQAREHFGAVVVNEHGGLNWNELITDDVDGAATFYGQALGHGVEVSETAEGGRYTSFTVGSRAIAGARIKPRPDLSNRWDLYFAVSDTAAAIDQVRSSGGGVLYGPSEVEGVGFFAGFTDPHGAPFMVVQLEEEID